MCPDLSSEEDLRGSFRKAVSDQQQQEQQQILLKIGKWLITLLSHPQIAYELIEAGGAENILQNKIYV